MLPPTLQIIHTTGVIAVVRLPELSAAVPLARALNKGGIPVIEFTLTAEDAPQAIAAAREALPDAVIGAGSVLTTADAHRVLDAGAQFVVSPITDEAVIDVCRTADIPVIPGAFTPTEIERAWRLGAAAVKVFPARGLGPRFISDVLAPMPHLRLIPTGGITAANLTDYLRRGAFAVGMGSALVNADAVAAGDWPALTAAARAVAGVTADA